VDISPRAIHQLNCGTMCPRGARLLAGRGGLLEPARLVCRCLLIEGAEGLVLVDTGFGSGDVADRGRLGVPFNAIVRPVLRADETAAARVRALGLQGGDVRQIIATHLDLDHAGGLGDFPDAEVHVMADELHAARHPSLRERERYVQAQWAHGPRWAEHRAGGGEDWFGFQGVRILPGSGAEILLIPLAGHTAGHTGVAIRRGDGWLLHCGDAYFHHGQVQTPPRCPPGLAAFQRLTCVDNTRRIENVERLRELASAHGGEVELVCSHDPAGLEQ
jgi:glyoxylase-like metal-dependent hydrolase (beta-lactamase superfamily II)